MRKCNNNTEDIAKEKGLDTNKIKRNWSDRSNDPSHIK